MAVASLPALMSPRALGEQFGVSERTLALWRQQGRGPRFVRVGGLIRYRADAVLAWLAERERMSTAV